MKHTHAIALIAACGLAIAAPQATTAQTKPVRINLDTNNDGVIDRAEAAKHPRLAARFDQLDTNKDGKLSADEMKMRGGKGMKRGKGGMHGKLMQLDTDKDGRISRAEAAKHPKLAERFDKLDANKDGYIDQADRQLRMQQHRDAWFKAADTNNDGQISRAEFDAAKAKRMQDRNGARGTR